MKPSYVTDDGEAWTANPAHRWVYDRLIVATRAGVSSAPAGIDPPSYPVIWKPITNLWGMGRGAFIADADDGIYRPGFMWSEVLTGAHVSTDALVQGGKIVWSAQAMGISAGPGRFAAWFLGEQYQDESPIVRFVADWLADYSGPVNVETIGGRIIEIHLRLTADWLAAYGDFSKPPARMIGVPLFTAPTMTIPRGVAIDLDDGDPRHGFIKAELAT